MRLYLTPVAIGYLTQLILVVLISGYLLLLFRQSRGDSHTAWLAFFFVMLSVFIATLFLEAALAPTPRLYAVSLQVPLLSVAWVGLLQFAYHFPALTSRRKARLSLIISGLYALWEIGYAVFRFVRLRVGIVEYRLDWTDYLLSLLLLWPMVILARKMYLLTPPGERVLARLATSWRRPSGRDDRALRAFALVFLFVASLSLLNLLRTFYLLPVPLANLGIALGVLIALFVFAMAYLNHRPETTSFLIKLAGATLTTVLAIMGVIGWVISPAHIGQYQLDLPTRHAMRFTPNPDEGYDVTEIPFAFETDFGEDLRLDDGHWRGCSEPLDFDFPFYGQDYRQVYACNDGAVSLERSVRYREFQYRYGGGAPLLLPLLIDLDPTISSGGVFARREANRLVLTWDHLRGFRQTEAEFTFQAILYPNGVFEFSYADLPQHLIHQANDDPGASVWAVGALPGGLERRAGPEMASLAALPLNTGPSGVLQDYHLEFRQHLHQLFAPLAGFILIVSLVIVVGFPTLFQVALVRPLNALLHGIQRIEAGDYTIRVPVRFHDEVGFITDAFNTLVAELGDLIHNLEARVAARTEELDRANAQLRAEIVEREQVQATVVEQQRALAAFDERERLGRDLHDGLGQVLGYINVQAQAAEQLLDQGQTEAVQTSLHLLAQAARQAHADVRRHILGLRTADGKSETGERMDLGAALEAYAQQFQARYGVTTRLWLPEDLPDPLFSPAAEQQALRIIQEAMTNAGKHAQATRLEVVCRLIGDLVQIVVADDGVGFKVNARRASDGAGHFGLEIMRERAEQIGGQLDIHSAPEQGTRISATLPRLLPTAEKEKDDQIAPGELRLLLADDHPLFLDGLRNLLIARGLTVVGMAHDGREVLEKTRALRPDVVVMDLNMPHGGGLHATRAIKAEFPEVKIVILTVSEDEAALFEAIKSGASGYLLKSLEATQFCRLLSGLMRGDAPLAPGMGERILEEFARSAAPDEPAVEEVLTPRQVEVLDLVVQGLTYKEVGETLNLSEQTIKYHMGNILEDLGVENRAQAIAYFQRYQK